MMNKPAKKTFFNKPNKEEAKSTEIAAKMCEPFVKSKKGAKKSRKGYSTELKPVSFIKKVKFSRKGSGKSKPKPQKKLTKKQECFCLEYIIDLNGTQAAIRAGYSQKTAGSIAEENLKKPEIKKEVQKHLDARRVRTEVKADDVIEEIKKMAFSNMLDYMTISEDGGAFIDLSKLTRDQAAAIVQLEVESYWDKDLKRQVKKIKFKLADKYKGQELLGKHIKMFNGHTPKSDGDEIEAIDTTGWSAEEVSRAISDRLNKKK